MATFALAQDNAFGQPLESQLRSCLLASWLSEEADLDEGLRETIYWVALLRYIGCTGHAHEVATVFGDEIAVRAQTLVHDAANPAEVMRDVIAFATANHPPEAQDEVIKSLQAGAHEWAVNNFASGCEVGDMLVLQLGFSPDVRDALRFTFERWNGNGYPSGAQGEQIPLAMRVVHLSHDMEAIGRLFSTADAVEAARSRRGQTYDPDLADLFISHGASWLERLEAIEPWDAVLALEPQPHRILEGADLESALLVAADFIDLKSPFMAGHSRRCAQLCEEAGAAMNLDEGELTRLRRAALVHEWGTTAVPNSILDKTSSLTRAEFDRVELHTMLTEQMLRRSQALADLSGLASAHHEKVDGSGYHKRLTADGVETAAQLLAAVDVYIGMTADRADRPALTPDQAGGELRRLAEQGVLAPQAVSAVLTVRGHEPATELGAKRSAPAGLTPREVEVVCLAARGLTTKAIGEQLHISPKTVDHHIQHVYAKIDVSTRAAAALWAMQNELVS